MTGRWRVETSHAGWWGMDGYRAIKQIMTDPVATELLASRPPARLAYIGPDGGPVRRLVAEPGAA